MALDNNSANNFSLEHIANRGFDPDFQMPWVENLDYDPTTATLNRSYPSNPLNLKPYDYVSRSVDTATVTWVFKSGGSGGTTTNTVVIVYTDSTLESISTITKT